MQLLVLPNSRSILWRLLSSVWLSAPGELYLLFVLLRGFPAILTARHSEGAPVQSG